MNDKYEGLTFWLPRNNVSFLPLAVMCVNVTVLSNSLHALSRGKPALYCIPPTL